MFERRFLLYTLYALKCCVSGCWFIFQFLLCANVLNDTNETDVISSNLLYLCTFLKLIPNSLYICKSLI